ncbi:zf-CCHC_4 domain-containing protein [Raphanus sativus]|nr:zf-CCHC_4 domain-containing protein [Raphanus sativus]
MMVDFDSGEETYITLEYEKLEAHCSYCFSLLHSRRNCNMKQEEESRGVQANQSNIKEISRISTSSNVQGNQVNSQEQNKALTETGQLTFKARVDRHGNPFGERVGTKQTRVPPPANTGAAVEPFRSSWKQNPKGASHQQYSSPQYTQTILEKKGTYHRVRDLFPQRSQGQWRPKQSLGPAEGSMEAIHNQERSQEVQELPPPQPAQSGENQNMTKELIMEELHEVMRQYLNCADPVEAAARRQRVMYTDANGLMEETAARILAVTQGRRASSDSHQEWENNPVTPPPRQDLSVQNLLPPNPPTKDKSSTRSTERLIEEAGERQTLQQNLEDTLNSVGRPARIKSIIVSPEPKEGAIATAEQRSPKIPEDGETMNEAQTRLRKGSSGSKKKKTARQSPNVLRGASYKKRMLSQIQNSPRRGQGNAEGTTSKENSRGPARKTSQTAEQASNPPTQLIPASRRRHPDFRAAPLPGP